MRATSNWRVSPRFTTVEIIGGYNAFKGVPKQNRTVDLDVHGGVAIDKNACIGGDLVASMDAVIEGNLVVMETSYLGNVFASDIVADSIMVSTANVTSKLNVQDLCVEGDAVFNGNVTGISITGMVAFDEIDVSGKATVGELCVDGDAEFNGNIIGNLSFSGDIDVTGKATLGELCVDSDSVFNGNITGTVVSLEEIDVSGKATVGELCVQGNVIATSGSFDHISSNIISSSSDLFIDSDTQIAGTLEVQTSVTTSGFSGDTLNLTQDATIAGNIIGAGKTTLEELCVNANTTLESIAVEGPIQLGGNISGLATLDGNGEVIVMNSLVVSSTNFSLTVQDGVEPAGFPYILSRTIGSDFTIRSSGGVADGNVIVYYQLFES